MIMSAVLPFIASGFAETYLAFQAALFTFGLIVCVALRANPAFRRTLPFLWCGLCGAILGAIVVGTAPGNSVRASPFREVSPLWALIIPWLVIAYQAARLFMDNFPWVLLLATVPGWLVTAGDSGMPRITESERALIRRLLLVSGFGAAAAASFPAAWLVGSAPPPRAQIISVLGLLLMLAALARLDVQIAQRLVPRRVRSPLLAVVIITALALGPAAEAGRTLSAWSEYATFATFWDDRDRQFLSAQPALAVDIRLPEPPNPLIGLPTTGPHLEPWLGDCIERYYRVKWASAA